MSERVPNEKFQAENTSTGGDANETPSGLEENPQHKEFSASGLVMLSTDEDAVGVCDINGVCS